MSPAAWLALDVGGANIKAAHSAGAWRSAPFELWKRPDQLPRVLENLAAALPPFDGLALTMTAELCDCFADKAEGVAQVVGAALHLAPQEAVRLWGIDGAFHSVADVLRAPRIAAAANWLALATVAARLAGPGPAVLVDVGTTTTDLVPLLDGRPVPRAFSDTDRLGAGELVYAGARRTPVCALAAELPWRGVPTGLAAELFATTLDVYLVRGEIAPDPADSRTADGRPATIEAARDRLARMVAADRAEADDASLAALADAADAALMSRLAAAARRALAPVGLPDSAVVAGSGRFLARRVAHAVAAPGSPIVDLDAAWSPAASDAACAHALIILAAEAHPDGPPRFLEP